jgi:hypothetical protein
MPNNESYRHYDVIESFVSSRKRTLLRRCINELESKIRKSPAHYANKYGISSDETIKTHLRDLSNLKAELNLE